MTTVFEASWEELQEAKAEIERLRAALGQWEAIAEKIPRLKDEYADLTAAAEVDCKCLHVSRHGHQKDCALAAEVGDIGSPSWIRQVVVAATIERCAQVVKQWIDDVGSSQNGRDLNTLLAAIRALKERP